MNNSNNIRLLNRVLSTFKRFRLGQISANDMISNVSGNLTALDGVDNDFINNIYGFSEKLRLFILLKKPIHIITLY
ncbi:MAG TPA: hypothetical protein LFV90_02175 [Rickettsia endosymbiont of Columbicola hoogstraali]|nr:hypothetical protein [Rickettsia endosymbiont of Columbicola hoogstraali]